MQSNGPNNVGKSF